MDNIKNDHYYLNRIKSDISFIVNINVLFNTIVRLCGRA